MFVKNLVDVSVSTLSISISTDDGQLYSGNIKSTPFYLLNERVKELSIFGSNIVIKIGGTNGN